MSNGRCTLDLGQVAYEAYADKVSWTTYDGQRIHPWDEQTEDRRAGWSAAGAAVVASVKVSIAVALLETIPVEMRAEALAAVQRHVAVAPTPGCSRGLLPEARSSCTCGDGDGCSACLVPAELVVTPPASGEVAEAAPPPAAGCPAAEREAAGCATEAGQAGDCPAGTTAEGDCPAGTRVVTIGGDDEGTHS